MLIVKRKEIYYEKYYKYYYISGGFTCQLYKLVFQQEFKFGYDNYIEKGFNKNKKSYPAKIVSLAKLDYKEEEEDEFDRYFQMVWVWV